MENKKTRFLQYRTFFSPSICWIYIPTSVTREKSNFLAEQMWSIKGEASILKTSWKIFHCGTIGRMHAKTWLGRWASSGPSLHSELSYVWMPPGSIWLLQHSRTNMKLLSRSRHKVKYILQMSCLQHLLQALGYLRSGCFQGQLENVEVSAWHGGTCVPESWSLLWPAWGGNTHCMLTKDSSWSKASLVTLILNTL